MSRKRRRELRDEMKLIISNLDPRWLSAASGQLCRNLMQLFDRQATQNIRHILAFTAHYPGEVDLTDFIVQQLSKRQVYLPRISAANKLSFFEIGENWSTELAPGAFGIPMPQDNVNTQFNPEWGGSTAVILPGLAFDKDGNRLSRDRGLYDIFLRKSEMTQAFKVGVCWSLQLVPEVPSESYQIMMDAVCHEREIVNMQRHFDEDFEH